MRLSAAVRRGEVINVTFYDRIVLSEQGFGKFENPDRMGQGAGSEGELYPVRRAACRSLIGTE
jgi:hypothetical protein